MREAGERLPSSLRLSTVLSVFMVLLLLAVTLAIFFGARLYNRAIGENVLAIAALACLGAVLTSLLFVRYYFGPVLRFAEGTLQKLQILTATLEQRVEERTAALMEANAQLRRSFDQNRSMQRQLMDTSRRAGMAQVATSVLHNVGNVLNSVNVSSGVMLETVRDSRLVGLTKTAELIRAHESDGARFFVEDEKGRKLPAYICSLAEAADDERKLLMSELRSLQQNVDHIKTIVTRQQQQAKTTVGVAESVSVAEICDEVLKLSAGREREGIAVERDYQPIEAVRLDRHKLFEVLANLVSNARHALDEAPGEKKIVVRIGRGATEAGAPGGERFVIEVADTGCGIPPENLTRIFSFGFTTRPGGHGFGLHASALTAAEMGGSLTAGSAGPGLGARFTLELPCQPPAGYVTSSSELPSWKPPS